MLDFEEISAWSLSFSDLEFVHGYRHQTRIGVAAQLLFFRCHGYFPSTLAEIAQDAIDYVCDQTGEPVALAGTYKLTGDLARRHRLQILRFLGFRRADDGDKDGLFKHLSAIAGSVGSNSTELAEKGYAWALRNKVFIPSRAIMERLTRSALHAFSERFLGEICGHLPVETRLALEASLSAPRGEHGFLRLKEDVGAAALDSVLDATSRLEFVQSLDLPFDLMASVHPSWVKTLVRRVEGETAFEMRWHDETKRLGLLAIYIMSRRAQLLDGLVDLLIELVHRIAADIEKVHGKERLLVDIATAAMEMPDGKVADVIYPVAGGARLKAIINEHRAKGTLDTRIQTVMRGSYANHYRRMLPPLLSVLEFRSNNETWRPVLDALALVRSLNEGGRRFAAAALAPEGSIPSKWRKTVIDERGRLNVISYELCVLTQLRERIRAKEIWVAGSNRYRNPDEDLPRDFAQERDAYYSGLNLTRDAHSFVRSVEDQLKQELLQLNAALPSNEKVRLRWHGKNRTCITPFDPLPEPQGLVALKAEINRRWPMTGLLDTLKETALETGFLDAFETSASREALARSVRDRRLLLCLYGLGTNAGLKRVAAGVPDISYDELKHIGRRYLDASSLRAACARVGNTHAGVLPTC
ncbi:transposase [Roseibium sp. TrichSKD4]|uniref:DUF4158 domain-containing protein n=1 Tax=Roseibium sp. TrichSKD4 TaxID=744980 RepID=UPI0001E569F6|nr:DUF4158 domain-containing protein [Roseibium sp. TrichSKD4]EFO31876.1 transposase [Roseibium sp. TrichSKD4]